jgi:hypothetical protein
MKKPHGIPYFFWGDFDYLERGEKLSKLNNGKQRD